MTRLSVLPEDVARIIWRKVFDNVINEFDEKKHFIRWSNGGIHGLFKLKNHYWSEKYELEREIEYLYEDMRYNGEIEGEIEPVFMVSVYEGKIKKLVEKIKKIHLKILQMSRCDDDDF